MKSDQEMISSDSLSVLHFQYTAAIGMLSQTNTRRTATARFFITLASALVGLLTIVNRPGVDAETQIWVVNMVAVASILLNLMWFLTIRSLRYLANIQRSLLKEMEEQLPFAFITRQEQILGESSIWLKTGLIEQYASLAMMVPAVWFLLTTNLG